MRRFAYRSIGHLCAFRFCSSIAPKYTALLQRCAKDKEKYKRKICVHVEKLTKNIEDNQQNINNIRPRLSLSLKIEEALSQEYLELVTRRAPKEERNATKTERDAIKKEVSQMEENIQKWENEIATARTLLAELEEKKERDPILEDTEHFIKAVADSQRFTHRFEFGMVGRDEPLNEVVNYLFGAKTSMQKEDLCPTAILSSPRQGKSLFLDEVALQVMEHDPDAVVVRVNMNGQRAMQVADSVDDALRIVWERMFGKSLGATMHDGETVREYLRDLFGRDAFIVILIDELTLVLEKLTDKELTAFGKHIVQLYGNKCAVIFTGYDHFLADTFESASGRVCRSVFLPPVFPVPGSVNRDFLRFLPLKVLLLLMYRASPTDLASLPLLYEFAKVTPGVLGALATRRIGYIPIFMTIRRNQEGMRAHMVEYARYCVLSNAYPHAGDPLGKSLLRDKIGVIMQANSNTVLVNGKVFVPPIFAFVAILEPDWDPEAMLLRSNIKHNNSNSSNLPPDSNTDNLEKDSKDSDDEANNSAKNNTDDDGSLNAENDDYRIDYDYKDIDDGVDNVVVNVNTAFGVTAAVVHQWVQQLETPNHELSYVHGHHFEYYVYSCLLFRLLLCSPPPEPMLFPVQRTWKRFIKHRELFYDDPVKFQRKTKKLRSQWNKPIEPLRLGTKYPTGGALDDVDAEQLRKRGIRMTCDGAPGVDMIIRVSPTEEIWVECKSGTSNIKVQIGNYIQQALDNAKKANIKKVEYVMVTPATEEQTGVAGIMKTAEKHSGDSFTFTSRTVTIGTEDAEWFLTPLLASVGPNMLAAESNSWEQRFTRPRAVMKKKKKKQWQDAIKSDESEANSDDEKETDVVIEEEGYIGMKSEEELRQLNLTDEDMARALDIREKCKIAKGLVGTMLEMRRKGKSGF